MGVFEHGLTREDLLKRGIDIDVVTPIPLTQALQYKTDKEGNVNRYKTRMPLAGHPGFMKKGIHYHEVFAPTPDQASTRILIALMVKRRLKRLTFDIAQAYCRAPLPEGEQIPVRYPDGFKRKCPKTGRQCFMLLQKSLYGHPAAGRYWDHYRNKTLLAIFNKDGYKAKRSMREPSMLVIKYEGEYAYLLIHTDDGDMVGSTDSYLMRIFTRINDEWECKLTDASFMLGIERNISYDPEDKDNMICEMKMTAFIEGMADVFSQYIQKKDKHTPVKEDMFIHKPIKGDNLEAETRAQELIEQGFQKLLGSLLWAARGVYPECLLGTSMLGRVMAKPTDDAWDNAVHMLNYMHQNRNRGIVFSTKGSNHSAPQAHVDASNKPDPTDSKCQYGYVISWQGGPIVAVSRKLSHIGLSAAHNEYMALHWCIRHVVWVRELLVEMGIPEEVEVATRVRADNTAANQLCNEDIVTTGNQFIITPYHYNKEAVNQQQVEVQYVPTADNIAGVMTKPVKRQVLASLLPRLRGDEAEDE